MLKRSATIGINDAHRAYDVNCANDEIDAHDANYTNDINDTNYDINGNHPRRTGRQKEDKREVLS